MSDNEAVQAGLPADERERTGRSRSGRNLYEFLLSDLLAVLAEREAAGGELGGGAPEAEGLLRDALRERATDIHLDRQLAGLLVRMRIDGLLLDGALLHEGDGNRLLNQLKAMAGLSPVTRYVPDEARISYQLDDRPLDLRLTLVPCLHGEKMNVRLFMSQALAMELDQLGLHEEGLERIQDWLGDISGLLMVAGPTGSGKTTTLYALLHHLKLHERSVVTIEDPVEYQVDGISHIQVDRNHGLDYAEGVKAMLRMDPDYLMLGEIRDELSAHAAISAATSGRALMSTIHSRDAVGVIDVLHNFGLSGHELSANLIMVIAQRLVRVLCPHCREEGTVTAEERRWLNMLGRKPPAKVWHAKGCGACRGLGYEGRTGVFEVWRIDSEEYRLILEGADRRSIYRQLAARDHRFLLDDGLDKVARGITTLSELRTMGGYSALPSIDASKGEGRKGSVKKRGSGKKAAAKRTVKKRVVKKKAARTT